MSFLKRLFGGGDDANAPAAPMKQVEHEGFVIRATPYKEGTEFQTCGVVSKEINGEAKEHRFVRAMQEHRDPQQGGAAGDRERRRGAQPRSRPRRLWRRSRRARWRRRAPSA